MKITPASTSIAAQIKQSLLKRALATISKRQLLYKNMNLYSLDQLTKIIQQINSQQALTINSAPIPQSNDHATLPYDNLMSMSQVKLMPTSKDITEYHPSQVHNKTGTKWHAAYHNKDRNSLVDLLEEDSVSRDYLTTCYLVGKQQKIEESAEIQAFRQMKINEQQALFIKRQSQQKKKQIPINLNNQRVMYGYDSKVVKLQKMKEKHAYHLSQMNSSLINLDEPQTKKKISILSKAIPIPIKNKINITQKQAQQQRSRQRQKQRKAKRTYKSSTIQEAPTITISVNPQSHMQIEQAIVIKQPGVKISFDKRDYSADRYTTTHRINRRLTRSEYLQIKSNQQVKQAYYRQHTQNKTDKLKVRPEDRLKTQYVKEEKSSAQFSSGKKYKLSLSTFYNYPKKQKSTIFTHSLQAKAQLLKQTKDKPFLFQTIGQSKSLQKQQSLSSVDKYNLLYQKYKGNPPQNLLSQLQTQSKILRQPKPVLLTYSKSITHENRLIRRVG